MRIKEKYAKVKHEYEVIQTDHKMAAPSPHQMMTCPYNMAHQVEHYRMHIHLQKCRKQYPNSKKTTCPFDATHVVNEVELDFHISQCPKRDMLDSQLYIMDNEYKPNVPVTQIPNVEAEENWDDDCSTSYKPDLSKMPSHIIMKPAKGLTPSERKNLRRDLIKNYKAPSQN